MKITNKAVLFMAALLTLFSVAIIGYTGARVIPFVAPLYLLAFYWGFSKPDLFWKSFFFLLPFAGCLDLVLDVHAMPLMTPFFTSGIVGISFLRHLHRSAGYQVELPIALYMLGILLSSVLSFLWCLKWGMTWESVIAVLPWATIRLPNAMGWVVWGFTIAFSGVLFYITLPREIKTYEMILRIMLPGLCVALAVALLQALDFNIAGVSNFKRQFKVSNGTFSDPSIAGFFSSVILILWVGFKQRRPAWNREWLFAIVPAALLMLSVNRSSYILAASGMLVLGILLARRRQNQVLWAVSAMFVLLLITVILHSLLFGRDSRLAWMAKMMLDGNGSDYLDLLINDRMILWRAGWITFIHNPVFGVGMGSFLFRMPKYGTEIGPFLNDNAQNMPLHILAEQGVVGILITLVLIGFVIKRFFMEYRKFTEPIRIAAFSAFLGSLLALLFFTHLIYFESTILFWFLIVIITDRGTGERVRT